eukprot:2598921-Prymnesium_polylepis.1
MGAVLRQHGSVATAAAWRCCPPRQRLDTRPQRTRALRRPVCRAPPHRRVANLVAINSSWAGSWRHSSVGRESVLSGGQTGQWAKYR